MRRTFHGLALVVTSCLASCDHQEAGRGANDKRIAAVEIEYVGEKTVDEDRLKSFIESKAGSSYTTESIDSSIRALYESGYIDDVRVLERAMGEDVRLIFEITTRPGVGPPLFIGNTVFSDQRLGRELDLGGGTKFEDLTEERFRKNASLIEEFYRSEGYPETKVTFRAFGGGTATSEDFQFIVEEGEKQPSP